MSAEELQQELLAALTPASDDTNLAHDFFHISGSYFADLDEYPESVEELTPKQLKGFARWLRREGISLEIRDAPAEVPPAYFFENPTPLPEGSWLIHHSPRRFSRFDRGMTLDGGLQLSKFSGGPRLAGAKNSDDEIGPFERVYAFAFAVEDDPEVGREGEPRPASRDKYGGFMLLFQCDAAVSAYHPGDEEQQAIFPVGSEYNVHQIYIANDSWVVEQEEGDEEFESIYDMISAIEEAADEDDD
jgi:hypothetical protein